MKQLSLFIILFISGLMLKAQAPEKINYQAVARDLSGNPLVNQTLNVTYEIRQSSPTGTSVYTETHSGISTNQFGLFTTEIGGGTPSFGTFAGINWGAGLHYLYVEVNGDPMGSSQLLSVPYALYSKQSANGPQGAPGKNSISIVTPEPTGANCQNGGNKIDIGTDDNGDNILQALEIDYTYYVCNGDSGATGLGVNWLGNGTNFPPAPNNENDAFYHSTNNTSYIYNGTTWDTLVSGNVGSAGFWSQTGNTIYNNNNSNSGNVSIGSTISLSKLTVASTDSTIASFIGNDPNIAVVSVINANTTGASGVAFVNGSNSNAYVGYSPSNKTLSIVNGVTDGHIFINSDSTIVNQTLVIANQAQKIANQAQTAIYNNTDTIYNYSSTGPIINANSGSFLTDSLYVLGNNFLNINWILANDGTGQAKWTDPNTLGLGNDNWGTQVVVSDATLNGDGTAGNPLSVNGVLTDNQDLTLTGNSLSLTNDPTPIDLSPYLDNTDAQTLSINANILSISNGNTVTLPPAPNYTAGTGISITGTQPNFTINNTSPASSTTITGGGITTVSGTSPNFTISTPAQTLTYTAPTLTLSNGGGTVTLPTSPWTKTGSTIHEATAGDRVGVGITNAESMLHVRGLNNQIKLGHPNQPTREWFWDIDPVSNLFLKEENNGTPLTRLAIDVNTGNIGIGTSTPLAKLHIEENASAVMMLKEVTPTNGAAFVMESMSQFVLISNESGTFRIEDNTNLNQPFNINPTGQVGIGGDALYSALDVYGKITMRNGATTGYIPVSDANGTMTWTDPNTVLTVTPTPWTLNGTSVHPTTITNNVGIGTATPEQKLDVIGYTRIGAGAGNTNMGLLLATPAPGISLIRAGGRATTDFRIEQDNNAPMTFHTNNAERVRITELGDIGIGTTTPTMNLHIGGTNGILINAAGSTGNIGGLAFREGYTTLVRPFHLGIVTYDHSSGGTGFSDGLVVSGYDGIAFTTDNSATSTTTLSNVRMFINQTGNVGIGTNNPLYLLDVNGITRSSKYFTLGMEHTNYSATLGNKVLVSGNSTGNAGNVAAAGIIDEGIMITNIVNRDNRIGFQNGTSGFGISQGFAVGQAPAAEGFVWQYENSHIQFGTNNIERMRIDAVGNLGIGTTTPSQKLDVDGGGSIEVDGEYTYETPKTHYYSVAGNSFVGTREGLDLWNASLNLIYGQWSSGSGTYPIAVAPINLPDGATITNVTAYIYDNDGTITYQPRIYLYMINMATGSYGTVGTGTLPGNSASTTPQTLSITTNHTVNNQNAYYLKFQSEGNAGSNIRLYGVKITYTVSQAD